MIFDQYIPEEHNNPRTVAFTGHRKLGGQYPPSPKWEAISEIVRKLALSFVTTDNIIHFNDGSVNEQTIGFQFISGGALGFDQVAASAIIRLRDQGFPVTLTFALPFPGFETKWPEKSRAIFTSLCRKSDKVVYVDNDSQYFPWKMQRRNEYMIDRAQTVIALKHPDIKRGGTVDAIKYAEKKGCDIIIINPTKDTSIFWMKKDNEL